MISGTSSVGKPCNLSEGADTFCFYRNFSVFAVTSAVLRQKLHVLWDVFLQQRWYVLSEGLDAICQAERYGCCQSYSTVVG